MNLFSLNDLQPPEPEEAAPKEKGGAMKVEGQPKRLVLAKAREQLRVLGELKPGEDIHFASRSAWSMHDLLFYLLEQTGPAKVTLATWAISEQAVRMLLQGLEAGVILGLQALLDRRVRIRKEQVLAFAQNICSRLYLVDCHAKILLIENDQWRVSVSGSANMTKNRRIEAGVISTCPEVFTFHQHWLSQELEGLNPFEVGE